VLLMVLLLPLLLLQAFSVVGWLDVLSAKVSKQCYIVTANMFKDCYSAALGILATCAVVGSAWWCELKYGIAQRWLSFRSMQHNLVTRLSKAAAAAAAAGVTLAAAASRLRTLQRQTYRLQLCQWNNFLNCGARISCNCCSSTAFWRPQVRHSLVGQRSAVLDCSMILRQSVPAAHTA
jgi:hypothetical protein